MYDENLKFAIFDTSNICYISNNLGVFNRDKQKTESRPYRIIIPFIAGWTSYQLLVFVNQELSNIINRT